MEAASAPVLVLSSQNLTTYRRVQWTFIVLGVTAYLLYVIYLALFDTVEIKISVANESSEEIDRGRPRRLPTGEYCLLRACVTKCCPDWQGFVSPDNRSCSFDNSSNPQAFMNVLTSRLTTRGDAADRVVEGNGSDHFIFIDRCGDGTLQEASYNESFMVADGSVMINYKLYVERSSSCFDFAIDSGVLVVQGCMRDINAHGGYKSTFAEIVEYLTSFCICTSTICLVAVLVVYSCISQLRNLQGKVLMCFVSSVIVFQFNFVTSSLLPTYIVLQLGFKPYLDRALRLSLMFWLSWLTIMCYDIWSTFSRPLKPRRLGRDLHGTKFLCYCVAGWGCPISITLAYILIFGDGPRDFEARAGFIVLEVYLNFVMFMSTLANMRLHTIARTDSLHSEGSGRHGSSGKDGFWLYGKLSFLMGFDWFVYLLALTVGNSEFSSIAFIVVESQGMFLFVFLVFNRRVFRLLSERCRTRL